MNWKDTLQKKLGKKNQQEFNEIVLDLLEKKGPLPAGVIYDSLPKKFRRNMNPVSTGMFVKRIPGVSFGGKVGVGGTGEYSLEKTISKGRKGSAFLHAVVREILTDEWISTEELHARSLDLKTGRVRPYSNRLGKSQLINSLLKRGLAESTGGKTPKKNLIRRKQ